MGDDTADPRLIGLGRDARAALVKMDGEKLTHNAIKTAMRWGSQVLSFNLASLEKFPRLLR